MPSLLNVSNICLTAVILLFVTKHVKGHGRLIDPPSRATMWRYGFENPADYNDNQGFCGGFFTQWSQNGGKCGVCGDPYNGPRRHEPGPDNIFANGIIVKSYSKNSIIEVTVQITAHHKGYFEFRLCPNNDPAKAVTQNCLDRFPLTLENGQNRFYLPNTDKFFNVKLRLPSNVVCTQCVLQWKYNTGNSWGCDDTGCGLGYGPQEQFYACADISITNKDKENSGEITNPPTVGTTQSSLLSSPLLSSSSSSSSSSSLSAAPTSPSAVAKSTVPSATEAPPSGGQCSYIAAGAWVGQASMTLWCISNCPGLTCLPSHCQQICE